jgi:hypothetical protein
VLNNGDSGFSEMASDKRASQEVTSESAVSTHSSKKSDDGRYVQETSIPRGGKGAIVKPMLPIVS